MAALIASNVTHTKSVTLKNHPRDILQNKMANNTSPSSMEYNCQKKTSGGSQEGQYIISVTKIKIWSALLLTDHGYNPKG